MRILRALLTITIAVSALGSSAVAQLPSFTKWSGKVSAGDVRAGESTQVLMTAEVEEGWHIYSLTKHKDGPTATSFRIESGPATTNGDPVEPNPEVKLDPNFNLEVGLHGGKATFAVPIQVSADAKGKVTLNLVARSQACNDKTCALPTNHPVKVVFDVAPGEPRPDRIAALTKLPDEYQSKYPAPKATETKEASDEFGTAVTKAKQSGIGPYLWFAFTAGLLALLTPCVFPMIPITVSYFSKQAEKGANRYAGPAAYSLGIIGTFTLLGLLTTVIFGASGINRLATNPFLNLALAALFVFLALNLFGMFELKLPSGMVNKFGGNQGGSGILPAVLMGLTFTLTSFTCTVPFVGTLLVTAAQGDILYPLLGMLAFSSAFALPFFLLAMFPQFLAKMPKSGGWLGTVKAYMGFLELAAAVKFLSNADLVWMLGLITRPVFLSIWSTILVIAALYLLGWMKLPFDSGTAKIGKLRYGIGTVTFAGSIYLLGAIQGSPLGVMSAFMPPDPYPGRKTGSVVERLSWHDTLDAAKAEAKAGSKLVFMDFTGVTCTNCRQMEQTIFPDPAVEAELAKMARAKLYTDRPIAADEANAKLMVELTKATTLPNYIVADADGKPIRVFQGSTFDAGAFAKFLRG